MVRNKTNKSKHTKRRRTNASSTKRKEVTPSEKITLYLNEALAIENAAVERLQLRIKQRKLKM
jgi:hypothetical protein